MQAHVQVFQKKGGGTIDQELKNKQEPIDQELLFDRF